MLLNIGGCSMALLRQLQTFKGGPIAPVPKILLRIEEAQDATGMSRSKIYDLVSRGELAYVKIGRGRGGGIRFRPEDLRAFAEKHLVK